MYSGTNTIIMEKIRLDAVEIAIAELLKGRRPCKVRELMKMNHYAVDPYYLDQSGITDEQCVKIVGEASAKIRAGIELFDDKPREAVLSIYFDMYEQARKEDNLREARCNVDSIVKLLGLAEPDKVELSGQIFKVSMT